MPGTLSVVATPIGNLEDISARALRVLREAALIAAEDTRRTANLLARYAITTPTTSLHEHNEETKAPALVRRLQQGEPIALVSDAGMPTISDPGQRLIRQALDAGVRVEVVPGPSAVITALAASGFPSDTFTFLGFPPIRSTDRSKWLAELTSAGRTVVFFEAPHRIRETLSQIQGSIGDVNVSIGRELTKAYEESVNGPISVVLGRLVKPKGEFTVVVNIGRMPARTAREPVSDEALFHELGEMTFSGTISRRRAVSALARRHNRAPNEIYRAIEKAKKSGK